MFIKERRLVDRVVTLNEVVYLARVYKREYLVFKVNFEKECNSVSLLFLDYMLKMYSFDMKWKAWIKACIFSYSLYVLLIGRPTYEISVHLGLKKGDPPRVFPFPSSGGGP